LGWGEHVKRRSSRRRTRPAGRPRGGSDELVSAILDATLSQLAERGFLGLRLEHVATAAGVAKTTLYRHWPTKPKLILAAWLKRRDRDGPALRESGDLRTDLIQAIFVRTKRMNTKEARSLGAALASLGDPESRELARALYETSTKDIVALIEGARARGEVRSTANAEAAAELLLALVAYRALTRKVRLQRKDIAAAVDVCLRGLGTHGVRKPR
jgi:AcrR family transcriptional regulator